LEGGKKKRLILLLQQQEVSRSVHKWRQL
jgi:hypothetical protein